VKPSIELRLDQQLTMTPQLQQAIKLLQLSTLDLQVEIQNTLDSNPLLDQVEDHVATETPEHFEFSMPPTAEVPAAPTKNFEPDRFTWSKLEFSQSNRENEDPFERTTQPLTLHDHLIWQMQLTPFTALEQLIATYLIEAIDDNGFLSCSLKDLQSSLKQEVNCSLDTIEAVLQRIQQFDPIGVGARSLKETLWLQLNHLPLETPLLKETQLLIAHYLKILGRHDYGTLRRRLGLSMTQLHSVIQCIQALNPRPGAEIGTRAVQQYIVPDLIAYQQHHQWKVKLNPECLPNLTINARYAGLIRQAQSAVDRQYLKEQLQQAKWFLKSLQNRSDTLLKVAQAIMLRQQAFFEQGEAAMQPMILQDIAQAIAMHESTVSRVTTQKYILTPQGTYELKYFFSANLPNLEGKQCSAIAIQSQLKKIIKAEATTAPLSDQHIAKVLNAQGFKVARRTITKYREAMGILPSSERKRLF
jgi:RNA polymerase sigma-54 factor